jgi:hypothetical protein
MRFDPDQPARPDQTAELERALIEEFLEKRGHTPASVRDLPEDEQHTLLREASFYASMRLSEVESRAHYIDDLHHGK